MEFDLDLNDALRVGAIVRGMEIDEADVLEAEELRDNVRRRILRVGMITDIYREAASRGKLGVLKAYFKL